MAAASRLLRPHRLLATLAVLAFTPQPVMGEAPSPSGLATCWEYLPPPTHVSAPATAGPALLRHAVSVAWVDGRPPAPIQTAAMRSATVSIGDAGLTGGPTMPLPPGDSTAADSITGSSPPADSTNADLGFFATTTLAFEPDAAAARRYRAAATPGRVRIYGIMTPEIAREMLERADRFPGESPKGMPLAEVLANNQLPKAARVAPGRWVADGTHVIGQPKSGG